MRSQTNGRNKNAKTLRFHLAYHGTAVLVAAVLLVIAICNIS